MRMPTLLAAALIASLSPFASHSYDKGQETQQTAQRHRHKAMLDQDIALALAPVKSKQQLADYIRSTPSKASPLDALSPKARDRFLASVTFNEKGITGFSYEDLQAELTASQIYKILSLFGAQHTTSTLRKARVESPLDSEIMVPFGDGSGPLCPSQPCDYDGYKCEARATCAPNFNTICMRNC